MPAIFKFVDKEVDLAEMDVKYFRGMKATFQQRVNNVDDPLLQRWKYPSDRDQLIPKEIIDMFPSSAYPLKPKPTAVLPNTTPFAPFFNHRPCHQRYRNSPIHRPTIRPAATVTVCAHFGVDCDHDTLMHDVKARWVTKMGRHGLNLVSASRYYFYLPCDKSLKDLEARARPLDEPLSRHTAELRAATRLVNISRSRPLRAAQSTAADFPRPAAQLR